MRIKRTVVVVVLGTAGVFGALVATPVFADPSGVVPATVSASAPCLTVSTTPLVFPTKKFSDSTGNSVSSISNGPTVSNCSGASANITGSASNAVNNLANTWTATAVSLTQNLCIAGGELQPKNKYALGIWFGSGDEPTITTNTLLKSVGIGANLPVYNLELFMPCTTSDGAGTTMSFSITFTASLP